jgi:hypothetical protein
MIIISQRSHSTYSLELFEKYMNEFHRTKASYREFRRTPAREAKFEHAVAFEREKEADSGRS